VVAGCSPAVDWREMRPDEANVRLEMPCRPASQERRLVLAQTRLALRLFVCQHEGGTFALAHARLDDPSKAPAVLAALREASQANVQGRLESEAQSAGQAACPTVGP
jgi:hypothetical protein